MYRLLTLCFFISTTVFSTALAQYNPDARTLGMGGTGVASSSGLASVRHNPANLMLLERRQRWEVNLGNAFSSSRHGFDISASSSFFDQFHGFYFAADVPAFPSTGSSGNLLTSWYPAETISFRNKQVASIMTGGISYTGRGFGISIAHHIRASNSFEIDRGWFDTTPVIADNLEVIHRNLRLHTSLQHEIGVAVAWEYELFSGWISDLGKIIIGIHPKVILPVHYGDLQLQSVYSMSDEHSNLMIHSGRLNSTTSGALTRHYQTGLAQLQGLLPVDLYPSASILGSIAGAGGGLDAGITYIIGLGNDISLISKNREPLRNSFRISFSITDVGIVSHKNSTERLRTPVVLSLLRPDDFPGASQTEFTGNPYGLISFLNSPQEQSLFLQATGGDTGPVRVLMPGRMHLGSAIQYGPILIAAELQYQSETHKLNPSTISYHIGTQLSLIRFMPLRWGMIFEAGEPILYTAGLGFDFRYFALNVGASIMTDDAAAAGILPNAAATSGLQLRF